MTGLPTKALFVVLALAGALAVTGCEVVAGIKHRPLAGGGDGGGGSTGGSPAGTGGTTGGTGIAGAGGSVGGAGGRQTRIGTSCPTLGEFDCDGQTTRTTLACGAGYQWTVTTVCPSGQLCDSRPGDTHGTCLLVLPECAEQSPQDHVCIGGELRACGPDLVSSELIDACPTAVGACQRCKPVVLAGGAGQQGQPAGIVVDAAYVYWRAKNSTSALGVARSPIDGSGGVTFLGGDLGGGYLGLSGSRLYGVPMAIAGLNGPATIPTEGGTAVALDTSGTNYGLAVPCLAVDDNNVYWSPGSTGYLGGVVLRLSLAGGSSAVIAMNQGQVMAITSDASNVYWTTYGGDVVKTPINGGPVDALATGQQNPNAIAVSAGIVYWSNGAGTVSAVSAAGGAVMTLTTGPNPNASIRYSALGIAVDATTVYWADPTNSKIMRVRKGGGAPVVVAPAALPLGLVIDGTSIYWANGTSMTIMKIAK